MRSEEPNHTVPYVALQLRFSSDPLGDHIVSYPYKHTPRHRHIHTYISDVIAPLLTVRRPNYIHALFRSLRGILSMLLWLAVLLAKSSYIKRQIIISATERSQHARPFIGSIDTTAEVIFSSGGVDLRVRACCYWPAVPACRVHSRRSRSLPCPSASRNREVVRRS